MAKGSSFSGMVGDLFVIPGDLFGGFFKRNQEEQESLFESGI